MRKSPMAKSQNFVGRRVVFLQWKDVRRYEGGVTRVCGRRPVNHPGERKVHNETHPALRRHRSDSVTLRSWSLGLRHERRPQDERGRDCRLAHHSENPEQREDVSPQRQRHARVAQSRSIGRGDLYHAPYRGPRSGRGLLRAWGVLPVRLPLLVPLLPCVPGLRVSSLLLALLRGLPLTPVSAVLHESLLRELREYPLPWVLWQQTAGWWPLR